MKAILTLTAFAVSLAAMSAHAETTAGGSVSVQSTPQGNTVVIQGGASIPVSKAVTVTPQVQVVIPPPVTQAPPAFTGGIGIGVRIP